MKKSNYVIFAIRKSDTTHKSLIDLVNHYRECDRGISCPLVDADWKSLPPYYCGELEWHGNGCISIPPYDIQIEDGELGKGGFGKVKAASFRAAPSLGVLHRPWNFPK